MRPGITFSALAFLAFVLPFVAGCDSLLGADFDRPLASDSGAASPDGDSDAARTPAADADSEAACGGQDATLCAGKCGQLLDSCGQIVNCGGCGGGEDCGGDGSTPNVCGPGTCTPSCTGAACGASDHCGGLCDEGSCPTGDHCANDVCACDSTSCTGCCSAAECVLGTAATACGTGGEACSACSGSSTCSAGKCGAESLVLFGGEAGFGGAGLNDTWTFDRTTWKQLSISKPPSARYGASMSTLGSEIVLFGGYSTSDGASSGDQNDTWTFGGASWTQLTVKSPPPARDSAGMATLGSDIVLFGGDVAASILAFDDTWIFQGATWSQLTISDPPSDRFGVGMSTLASQIVLFGGSSGDGPILNDAWTFNGTNWTTTAGEPPALEGVCMATLGNKVVLFGGYDGTKVWNVTWTFDGTNWLQPAITASPPARQYANMATLGSTIVLFGGNTGPNGGTDLNDTWTFDGKNWAQVSVTNPPPARDSASMALLP